MSELATTRWFATPRFGLVLVVIAACLFGAMGILVKSLDNRVALAQLAFLRGALAFVPLTVGLWLSGTTIGTSQWKPLCLRGVFGLGAMLCYFWALGMIPIADAVVLNYTSPLFAAVLAVTLLGERLRGRAAGLLVLACAGVALVMQPSFRGAPSGYVVALGAGVFSGAAFATVKYLTSTHSPWRIVWYFSLVTCVLTAPVALTSWQWPSNGLWGTLIGISLLGTGGQLLMTYGFRHATVAHASAGTLFILVVTVLGGWLVWNETPTWVAAIGMLIIGAAITGLGVELRTPSPEPATRAA